MINSSNIQSIIYTLNLSMSLEEILLHLFDKTLDSNANDHL